MGTLREKNKGLVWGIVGSRGLLRHPRGEAWWAVGNTSMELERYCLGIWWLFSKTNLSILKGAEEKDFIFWPLNPWFSYYTYSRDQSIFDNQVIQAHSLLPWKKNASSLLATRFWNIKHSVDWMVKERAGIQTIFETSKNGTQKWVLHLPVFQKTNWAKSFWNFLCSTFVMKPGFNLLKGISISTSWIQGFT